LEIRQYLPPSTEIQMGYGVYYSQIKEEEVWLMFAWISFKKLLIYVSIEMLREN
jgi:hypothetical protein